MRFTSLQLSTGLREPPSATERPPAAAPFATAQAPDKTVERLRELLGPHLAAVLTPELPLGPMHLLYPQRPTADDVLQVLIRNRAGAPLAVLSYASAAEPDLVVQAAEKAATAREMLGSELGRVVPVPLLTGYADDRSFALHAYYHSLARAGLLRRIQTLALQRRILSWLRLATQATIRVPSRDDVQCDFVAPLTAMHDDQRLSASVRDAAARASGRLRSGAWAPRYVLAHNDFWLGNILLHGGWSRLALGHARELMVIDWGAAMLKGHAMYDLIRLARSLQLPRRILFREVACHCQILGCSITDAQSYVIAALAFLRMHPGRFPFSEYQLCVDTCLQQMQQLPHGSGA